MAGANRGTRHGSQHINRKGNRSTTTLFNHQPARRIDLGVDKDVRSLSMIQAGALSAPAANWSKPLPLPQSTLSTVQVRTTGFMIPHPFSLHGAQSQQLSRGG